MAVWFSAHKRSLPFRDSREPYHIWVSEILAQQTRITALLPFYTRFIERFPDIRALAEADEDEVLAVWAGMGYYARARNLHKAARAVCEQYGGELPRDSKLLRALPGIGAYTAGAIASIAFGQPEPAIDGNVRRVYARLWATDDESGIESFIRALMDHSKPSVITEGLMELGALVCVPGQPRCGHCPWETLCDAKQQGMTGEFPRKTIKPGKKAEQRSIILTKDAENRYLLRKRSETLLHNMYEFPEQAKLTADGFAVVTRECVCKAEHIFTHKHWFMQGWTAAVQPPESLPPAYGWYRVDEMQKLAIPAAMRAFVEYVTQ